MTRVICFSGGKGGVGKTTLTANIGTALAEEFNQKVLVVDANLTTPNLGFHLGVPLYPKTLHDLMKGEAKINEATYIHPSGLNIIPASIAIDDLKNTNPSQLTNVMQKITRTKEYDIVLLDCSAGLGKETITCLNVSDELLIVTNPNLPSVTDALKTIKISEEMGIHILGVALNKVKDLSSELSIDEIESLLGYPIISTIPEDDSIQEGIAAKTPVVSYKPHSDSAIELKKLAASLIGIEYKIPRREKSINFFSRIFNFLK